MGNSRNKQSIPSKLHTILSSKGGETLCRPAPSLSGYESPLCPRICPVYTTCQFFSLFLLTLTRGHVYWFLERGKEGEREKLQCERETSAGWLLHAPQVGAQPGTWACALAGDQTHNRLVYGITLLPTELHHPGHTNFSMISIFMICSAYFLQEIHSQGNFNIQ